jgi:glutamate-ammonia-ligase adenylyltransferase
MNNIDDLISSLPDPESARRFLVQFAEKHPSHERKLQKNDALLSDVLTLVAYSPLLAATMLQHPEYIGWLQRKRGESVSRNKGDLLESLARFSLTNSQVQPHVLLSRFRRRELLRIYLRDIRRLATVAEITEEISNLADAILEHALRLTRQELDNRLGPPQEKDEKGRQRPAEICVVALGKLGSRELNYSSDIDLLFIYSDEGSTTGVGTRDPVTNREYFIKLAESITKLVGEQSGEGAAYRVDLRLRPHGRVGPLAMSLKDTVRYYTNEAAAWERQVLIRSRSSAGSESLFKRFWTNVEDSVFSTEGSVENALRDVRNSKQKIDLENINAKGINVKLGHGGIREIEFIAQALQLAHGGRDKWLRVPHTLISLARLADRKLISETELTKLADGYSFLRQLEHIIQMENGLQTQTVPNEPSARAVVGKRMRFANAQDFDRKLERQMGNVHSVFRRVFSDASIENAKPNVPRTIRPDLAADTPAVREDLLAMSGPNLFAAEVLRVSPRFGELLSADPTIVKVIPKHNTEFPERNYHKELADAVAQNDDFRARLGGLRQTWRQMFAEIIVFDALDKLSLKRAKRLQTHLAEASIGAAIQITSNEIAVRFGQDSELPLAIMGLGKLGGAGVDYDSDLDLVIVYDDAETDLNPQSAIRNPQLSARAVEIFVNTLSAMTREGSLYRVDLRLRPHGKDGPLAISRSGFAEYIRESSAIWELLAFVKLRGVGGDMDLAKEIEDEIRGIIHEKAKRIDPAELADETRRIRVALEKKRADIRGRRDIDIKYGEGGMLDIYFAIRFLQLRDGLADEEDSRSTDKTLERLHAAGSLTTDLSDKLLAGYRFISALDHNLRLTVGRTTRLPVANRHALTIISERMKLASVEELIEQLTAHRLDIRNAFHTILHRNS